MQAIVKKIGLATRHPQLALLRLADRFERKAVARIKRNLDLERERERSLQFLTERFDCDARAYLEEYRQSDLPRKFAAGLKQLDRTQSSSAVDCESLYLTIRAARPTVVVETGVLHGAMTWHVLEAMERNGGGIIHSIDLPRPANDPRPPLGVLIPKRLRGAWKLHLGDSLQVLPNLLRELEPIHLFHHDSCHTIEHMMAEYILAHEALIPGGVLTSHDVLHSEHYPNAFPLFAKSFTYQWICCRNFGIARKP